MAASAHHQELSVLRLLDQHFRGRAPESESFDRGSFGRVRASTSQRIVKHRKRRGLERRRVNRIGGTLHAARMSWLHCLGCSWERPSEDLDVGCRPAQLPGVGNPGNDLSLEHRHLVRKGLWSCPLAPHEPAPNAHRRPRLVPHRCFSSDRCGHRPTVPVVTPLESAARRPPAGPPRRPLAADAATSRSTKPIGSNQSTLNHRLRPMRTRGAMPVAWGIEPAHVSGSTTSVPVVNCARNARTASGDVGRSVGRPSGGSGPNVTDGTVARRRRPGSGACSSNGCLGAVRGERDRGLDGVHGWGLLLSVVGCSSSLRRWVPLRVQ